VKTERNIFGLDAHLRMTGVLTLEGFGYSHEIHNLTESAPTDTLSAEREPSIVRDDLLNLPVVHKELNARTFFLSWR
jgi:hypothetical protein